MGRCSLPLPLLDWPETGLKIFLLWSIVGSSTGIDDEVGVFRRGSRVRISAWRRRNGRAWRRHRFKRKPFWRSQEKDAKKFKFLDDDSKVGFEKKRVKSKMESAQWLGKRTSMRTSCSCSVSRSCLAFDHEAGGCRRSGEGAVARDGGSETRNPDQKWSEFFESLRRNPKTKK